MPTITVLYAGILGLMSFGVAFPAGQLRGKTGISVGDGGNTDLLLAMRRQANFLEVVPLALILIALLEMNGVRTVAIHAFGIALITFRIVHAFALKADTVSNPGRAIGAGGSALLVMVLSIWAIVTFVT